MSRRSTPSARPLAVTRPLRPVAAAAASAPAAPRRGWFSRVFGWLWRPLPLGRLIGRTATAPAPEPLRVSDEELVRMIRALRALLARHPASRVVLRNLAYVERQLRREGLDALMLMPGHVLRRALEQLESLVQDWSEPPLAALRSHMAQALKAADQGDAAGLLSSFEDRVQVQEASHSRFLELQRGWSPTRPVTQF